MADYRSAYTGNQIDTAIGKVINGTIGVPNITIALNQVVSQNPLKILLTAEQTTIWSNNNVIDFDFSALGMQGGTAIAEHGVDGFMIPNYIGGGVDGIASFNSYYDLNQTQIYIIISIGTISSVQPNQVGAPSGYILESDGNGDTIWSSSLPILTTAPSSANTNGLIIVVLSSEPATKYSGYLYLITE